MTLKVLPVKGVVPRQTPYGFRRIAYTDKEVTDVKPSMPYDLTVFCSSTYRKDRVFKKTQESVISELGFITSCGIAAFHKDLDVGAELSHPGSTGIASDGCPDSTQCTDACARVHAGEGWEDAVSFVCILK